MPARRPAGRRAVDVLSVSVAVALIYVAAVGLRLSIVATFRDYLGWMPFTLESSLSYHYAEVLDTTGSIPAFDPRVGVPEGIAVARVMEVGKEYPAVAIHRLWFRDVPFHEFMRAFDAAVASLSVIPLYLLVRERTRHAAAAPLAALLYAIAIPAVTRSTGIEYLRENFALPFIFFHLWLMWRALRLRRQAEAETAGAQKKRRAAWRAAIAAAPFAMVAAATWDMTQVYLLSVAAYLLVTHVLGRRPPVSGIWIPTLSGLVVAGAAVPYLRAHAFLASHAMVIGYALTAARAAETWLRRRWIGRVVAVATLIAAVAASATLTDYSKRYAHFRALLFAKLREFNTKPTDPTRLDFDARILWTPALHSATSRFAGKMPVDDFVPRLFGLLAVAAVFLVMGRAARVHDAADPMALYLAVTFSALYLLFVRMEVFAAFFVCTAAGFTFGALRSIFRSRVAPLVWAVVVGVVLSGEALAYRLGSGQTTASRAFDALWLRFGRQVPYEAQRVLVQWLASHTGPDDVVLADFTTSPVIYQYAGRPIVLYGKFETAEARDRVRAYYEAFYAPDERTFQGFCRVTGARVFVLSSGMFAGPDQRYDRWVYSPRYVAAQMGDRWGTRRMWDRPTELRFFRFETEIGAVGDPYAFAYRVFTVVSDEEMAQAREALGRGQMYLDNALADDDAEAFASAERELAEAVRLYPGLAEAHSLLATVYARLGKEDLAAQSLRRWRDLQQETP